MSEETYVVTVHPPSRKKIAVACVVALLVAGVLLATVVLPAEYGIDPLGTGKALRLMDLAEAGATTPAAAEKPTEATSLRSGEAQPTITSILVPAPDGGAPTRKNAFIPQSKGYKIDSREMTLAPNEGMEIKYNLKMGGGLIYSWTASDKLFFEFHGDPNVKPAGKEGTDYYETYDIDNQVGKDAANGTFIAPSSGVHGWFWENKTGKPVTIKLTSAGFYDWIFENKNDKQSALKTMDPAAIPGHPKVPDEKVQ